VSEEEKRKRLARLKAWQAQLKKPTEDPSAEAPAELPRPTAEDEERSNAKSEAAVAAVDRPVETAAPATAETTSKKRNRWDEVSAEDSGKTTATSIGGVAAPTAFTSSLKPTLHQKPMKTSRWDAAAETAVEAGAAASSSLKSKSPHMPSFSTMGAAEGEEDPLDAFMSSLYGSGEIAGQQELKSATSLKKSAPSLSNTKPPAAKPFAGEEEDNIEDALDLNGSHVGPGASAGLHRVITWEEIMKDQSQQLPRRERRGWESDVVDSGVNSPERAADASERQETDEEREAREERERREFVEAIRKAREEEDKALQRLQKIEEEQEQSIKQLKEPAKQKGEALGRVFLEDQDLDLLDEFEDQQKKRSALELLEEARKGKVLKPVDHGSVQYLPFRKNLYVVPRALAKLSADDVAAARDHLQIKVHGNGCPPPVETWEQCGLSDRILDCIYQNDLREPFAIQRQAIPAIMCGRDVIGVAKTGSGKTLAFLLPMFRHILDQPPLQDGDGPIGLVMAPARELAFQIFNEAKKFCRGLGLRAACIYGGAGVAEQIADLKRGSEIVVCTPGRMIDILCMQAGKLVSLKRVTMVVMDEADRMFDMGFEPQIRMIVQNVRPDRQTVLFSATFPKAIEKLAKSMLRLPLEIVVGERSTVNKDITQIVEVHEEDDKFLRLLQLLGIYYELGSVLVFVDKQEKCDQLFHELLQRGYPCLSLHGGKDQVDRDHTLHEFKTGVKTVMIATSVAGRGLDVPEIVCVVNYHCPNHLEDYVHRVGRTGRAGRKGVAYTFVSPSKEEQYAPIMVKALQKASAKKEDVPAELLALAEKFKEKVARGEAQWSSSGFVGKGFTFDANELNEAQRAALLQKKQYALEQGIAAGDQDDAEDRAAEMAMYMDDLADANVFLPLADAAGGAAAAATAAAAGSAPNADATATTSSGPVDAQSALAKARVIAQQLLLNKQATGGAFGGNAAAVAAAGLAAAAAIANGLAAGSGAEYFSDEFEINDYPIQARRKVTNKNALDEITERTGVAIISRGTFVPPGKRPEAGEKKLFLLIEGRSELSVRQAKMEIQRALEEETVKIAGAAAAGGGGGGGRYSVV
jgi:ATP-dependent RNA helicase DDX46/PRP5